MKSDAPTSFKEVKRIRLGDYIERSMVNNQDMKYGPDLIQGVTNEGKFANPRGSTNDIDLKPYKIVNNGAFVYNPSRLNLGSIAYRTEGMCIVSHLYVVFYLNDEGKKIIDPEYLFIYFRRKEFYREVTFRNFGSQRPEFNFYDMSDIIIPLPDLSIQKQFAAINRALCENLKSYEDGLHDLQLSYEACLERVKEDTPRLAIGCFLTQSDLRNENNLDIESVRGLSNDKKFIATKANMNGVSLRNYKIVLPGSFAYVTVTSRNGGKITIALNDSNDTYLVSSSYIVFSTDDRYLIPEYLMMLFNRSEFDRYARFHSWGSARETFSWDEMCNVEIPIPSLETQKYLVNIFKSYVERKRIVFDLKKRIGDMCPILVRGSLEMEIARRIKCQS